MKKLQDFFRLPLIQAIYTAGWCSLVYAFLLGLLFVLSGDDLGTLWGVLLPSGIGVFITAFAVTYVSRRKESRKKTSGFAASICSVLLILSFVLLPPKANAYFWEPTTWYYAYDNSSYAGQPILKTPSYSQLRMSGAAAFMQYTFYQEVGGCQYLSPLNNAAMNECQALVSSAGAAEHVTTANLTTRRIRHRVRLPENLANRGIA